MSTTGDGRRFWHAGSRLNSGRSPHGGERISERRITRHNSRKSTAGRCGVMMEVRYVAPIDEIQAVELVCPEPKLATDLSVAAHRRNVWSQLTGWA